MNSWPFLDLSFPLCRIGSGTRQSLDVICTSDEYVPKFIVINTFFKEGGDGKEGRAPSLGLFLHPSFFCSAGRSGQAPLCRQMSIRLRHPPACSCSETLSPFSQQRGHWASPLRPACCPGERAGTLGVRPRHRQPPYLLPIVPALTFLKIMLYPPLQVPSVTPAPETLLTTSQSRS